MNKNLYKARWKQIRGKSRIWRAKITHHRLGQLSGKLDVMLGKIQEKCVISRQNAAKKFAPRNLIGKSDIRYGKYRSKLH